MHMQRPLHRIERSKPTLLSQQLIRYARIGLVYLFKLLDPVKINKCAEIHVKFLVNYQRNIRSVSPDFLYHIVDIQITVQIQFSFSNLSSSFSSTNCCENDKPTSGMRSEDALSSISSYPGLIIF